MIDRLVKLGVGITHLMLTGKAPAEEALNKLAEKEIEISELRSVIRAGIHLFEDGPPNVSDSDCEDWVAQARQVLKDERT